MNINISFSKIELNFNTKINSCLNNFFLLNTPLFNLVLELPKFSISTSSLAKGFWSSPLLTSFLRSGADQTPLASEDAISINEKFLRKFDSLIKQQLVGRCFNYHDFSIISDSETSFKKSTHKKLTQNSHLIKKIFHGT